MNIVQVLGGNEDGGLEKHVIELCNDLAKRSHKVTLISHKRYESFLDKGVAFRELDMSVSRYSPFMLFKLVKILNSLEYEIIHTHANKATQIVNSMRTFLKHPKIVSTLHSYKKNLSMFEKSDFVISVSDKVGQRLTNVKKATIYNGIEPKDITNKEELYSKYNVKEGDCIVSSIGRLVDVKGFDILLEAFIGIDAKLLIVGEGKEEENLKNLTKKLALEEQVLFTGFVKNVEEIIAISDLVVIASKKEGFPYTFVETTLHNKPIISTDVSDIAQIIDNRYIVNYGDVKGLHEKISYFRDNFKECNSDFLSVYEFAQQNLTREKMVDKTIEIYKKVLH